jgi:hypothetical protein
VGSDRESINHRGNVHCKVRNPAVTLRGGAGDKADSTRQLRTVRTKAVYCPQSTVKLLSITGLLQAYPDENVNMTTTGLTLSGCKKGEFRMNSIYATIDKKCNLPVSQAYPHSKIKELPKSLIATVSGVDRENQNLGDVSWSSRQAPIYARYAYLNWKT